MKFLLSAFVALPIGKLATRLWCAIESKTMCDMFEKVHNLGGPLVLKFKANNSTFCTKYVQVAWPAGRGPAADLPPE